ncbi:hypothetical protein D3C78_1573540 [compost metagenome]
MMLPRLEPHQLGRCQPICLRRREQQEWPLAVERRLAILEPRTQINPETTLPGATLYLRAERAGKSFRQPEHFGLLVIKTGQIGREDMKPVGKDLSQPLLLQHAQGDQLDFL